MKQIFLIIAAIFLFGCGSDTAINRALNEPISSGVAHRNWGSYNLYRFENGNWRQIVALGNQTAPIGDLGPSPVMVVHGLGNLIRSNTLNPLAASLLASGATSVFGFEYDTLDSVATNGAYLTNAYQLVNQASPGRLWRHVSHSMGCLVSRVAFEGSQLPIAASGNQAVLVAGPHLGTPIADAIGRDPEIAREAVQYLVFHNIMNFTNSDFQRCDVTGTEQGILQLRDGDTFTANLNVGAATRHPQWEYRTVAGDRRGADFESIDALLGVFVDDGIVNTVSANAPVIGGLQSAVVAQDHSRLIDSTPGLQVILQFLQL